MTEQGPYPTQPPGPPIAWVPPAPSPEWSADEPDPYGADPDRELTAVPWGIGTSIALVFAMIGFTFAAGIGAAFARRAGFDDQQYTLVLGALLSGAYIVLVGIVWLVARAKRVKFSAAVGLRRVSPGILAGAAIGASVAGRVAATVWGVFLQAFNIELPGQNLDPSKIFPPGALGVALTVLIAVVLAPIAEEIIFRGVLMSALERRWGATTAIVASSAIFAGVHVTPFAIPPIFVFALILGRLFTRTRSLTVCIAAHAAFNGIGLGLLYLLRAAGAL